MLDVSYFHHPFLADVAICSVGQHDATACSNIKRKKTDGLNLEKLDNLNDDISSVFSTINTSPDGCPSVTYTEKWLILQRSGIHFSTESTICESHRKKFNQNYRRPKTVCQYPGHLDAKKKLSLSVISIKAAYQAQCLFSSAAQNIVVPIGGSWCSSCRLRLHPENLRKNQQLLNERCQVCFQEDCLPERYK